MKDKANKELKREEQSQKAGTDDRRKFLKRAGGVGAASAVALLLDASKQASANQTGESNGCGCSGGSIL